MSVYFKKTELGKGIRKLILPPLLIASVSLMAQSNDKAKLTQLKTTFEAQHKAAQKRVAIALAKPQQKLKAADGSSNAPLQKRFVDKDGKTRELIDVRKDGTPVYFITNNAGAASTVKTNTLYPGGSLGLNLTGAGEEVAVWDAGHVRTSHELFGGRVIKVDVASEEHPHSTHVGGTMIGGGNVQNGKAQGMSFQAKLLSYEWSNDVAEAADAVANRNLLISNHSYGWAVDPWTPLYLYGKYNQDAANWDALHEAAPYYLQVKSAGNPRYWMNLYHAEREGFDVLSDFSVCKNNMVVAAVEESNYTGPASVKMSSFSGYGPTDDGRIKPDISAKGVHTFSAVSDADNAYEYYDGTSMAAPSVAGSLLLLQQYYKQQTGAYLKAATLKGIALHTASEAGTSPGPDYRFGWGLLNMQDAALAIKNRGTSSIIKENTLAQNQIYTYQVVATSTNPLIVSITWTDPVGTVNETEIENERAAHLVNDLDTRVFDGSLEYKPWVMNPYKPNDPAKRADNLVDNIEKIEITPAYVGQIFTVKISHKGTLKYGTQNYSLIVTGGKELSATCSTPAWRSDVAYAAGAEVSQNGLKYKSKWWTLNESPATHSAQWDVWVLQGPCGDNNVAPTVSIASPLASSTITGLGSILVRINASDADGSISNVFAKITDQLGTVYHPVSKVGNNYDLNYTPRAYGTLIITAVAVDNLNKPSESTINQKVWETVTTPSLSIVSPENGSIAYVGLENPIAIKAAGTVNKNMGVFISGAIFLPETRLPGEGPDYSYVFVPAVALVNQTVTLKVELRDLSNNSVVQVRNLNLLIKQNILPTVEMLSSTDTLLNDVVTWRIRARANDADGTVSKVILRYFDGNDFSKMELTKSGNVYYGDYTTYFAPIWNDMQVYAIDNREEESIRQKVTVRVATPGVSNPPLVFISSPANDSIYRQSLTIPFHYIGATYNSIEEGPEYIIQTRIFLDGSIIKTINWDKKVGTGINEEFVVNSYGLHTFYVETRDERGLIGSQQVRFTVSPQLPEISIVSPQQEQTIYTSITNPTAHVEVDVNDEVVGIDSVKYIVVEEYSRYANVKRFTVTQAPYALDFVPSLDAYRTEITAIAFSNGVGAGTPENRVVYYRPDIQPTVVILTPTEDQEFLVDPSNLPNITTTVDVNNEQIAIDSVVYTIEDLVSGPEVRRFVSYSYPFTLSYKAVVGSRERIFATAFGNKGRYSTTAERTIYIRSNQTSCSLALWNSNTVYLAGNEVQHNCIRYKAKWWNQNNNPAQFSGPWDVWQNMGTCNAKSADAFVLDETAVTTTTRAYPNPSSGKFVLESGMSEAYTVSVQNMNGKEVFNKENITQTSYTIDLTGEAKGVYVIKITSGAIVTTKQLVLE